MVPEMQSWWTLQRVTGWTTVGSALVRRGSWATVKSGHTPWISWISALSPLCLLACMTVHSRSLGTTLGNYCIGCPPGPVCGMESGSMHIPPQPLDSLGYSKEIPSRNLCTLLAARIRHCVSECIYPQSACILELLWGIPTLAHQSLWWPGSGTMHTHVPLWPLCTLSCSGEFPCHHPLCLTCVLGQAQHTCSLLALGNCLSCISPKIHAPSL